MTACHDSRPSVLGLDLACQRLRRAMRLLRIIDPDRWTAHVAQVIAEEAHGDVCAVRSAQAELDELYDLMVTTTAASFLEDVEVVEPRGTAGTGNEATMHLQPPTDLATARTTRIVPCP